MTKNITQLFLAFFFLAQWAFATPVAVHGQLSVSGTKIVDKNNQAYQLRGMSLFWSQWEGNFWTSGVVKIGFAQKMFSFFDRKSWKPLILTLDSAFPPIFAPE